MGGRQCLQCRRRLITIEPQMGRFAVRADEQRLRLYVGPSKVLSVAFMRDPLSS
jgi:hypothetical protein